MNENILTSNDWDKPDNVTQLKTLMEESLQEHTDLVEQSATLASKDPKKMSTLLARQGNWGGLINYAYKFFSGSITDMYKLFKARATINKEKDIYEFPEESVSTQYHQSFYQPGPKNDLRELYNKACFNFEKYKLPDQFKNGGDNRFYTWYRPDVPESKQPEGYSRYFSVDTRPT
jgi:hypothetical protein